MKTKITLISLGLAAIILGSLGYYAKIHSPISTAGWKTYTNTEYGFEFKYPGDHTAYSEARQGKYEGEEKLIPASEDSVIVSITENEPHLWCCEPSTLKFSVAESHSDLFPDSDRKHIKFHGKNGTEMNGLGNLGSFYKIIRVNISPNNIGQELELLIYQNSPSPMLDKVLSTFRFTR